MADREHLPIERMDVFLSFVQVADWVWERVSGWQPLAQDTVGKQLIRAIDSVGANLVEGDGRFAKGDGLHFFTIARASARETRYWLERARVRHLLSDDDVTAQMRILEAATRQLNTLIAYRRSRPAWVKEMPTDYDPFTDY